MIIGLLSAYQLSPEQWLKLERDSAEFDCNKSDSNTAIKTKMVCLRIGEEETVTIQIQKRPGIADQKRKDSNCNGIFA